MIIRFDENATANKKLLKVIEDFFTETPTLESKGDIPIIIFQDGVKGSYYNKCSIKSKDVSPLFDFDARLESSDAFRANRELMLQHKTYQKMLSDAGNGREFNDIIVEFSKSYNPDKPLKIWGGQHRSKALTEAGEHPERYHGFKIFFELSTDQRTELALISNTNISVSNDTFDRMLEETMFGDTLRKWCQKVGLLAQGDDFPDVGPKSEKVTVKLARTFIVNFYLGKKTAEKISGEKIDKTVYEPYLADSGTAAYLAGKTSLIDLQYQTIMETDGLDILNDKALIEAGKSFAILHKAQQTAVRTSKGKIKNSKSYRNKALVESILSGWSFVAGLLQNEANRLKVHYIVPKTSSKVPDPLNAHEMSRFKHEDDPATYRGYGTRSSPKDRQRVAQLFLARSLDEKSSIDNKLMQRAVSQVRALNAFKKGYTHDI